MTSPGARPLFPDGTDVEAATDELLAAGLGDGLPVVPPTAARLAAMLAGVAEPDAPRATVPPLFGELTAAAAAWFAVLAGCRPGELAPVLAAAEAACAPEFNLLGVQTTTGTAAVLVVLRGPVVRRLGLDPGSNVLGPGNRANACVGRAVALTLAGVGGAWPGETDMATTGQPGRYTFCLPLHPDPAGAGSGDGPDATGGEVTVIAVGGTAEVLPRGDGARAEDVIEPLAQLCAGSALAAGDPARMAQCEQVVVLPPEVAARLGGHGLDGTDLAARLCARGAELLGERGVPGGAVARDPDAVHVLVSGGPGIKMLHLPGWIGTSRAVTRPVGR